MKRGMLSIEELVLLFKEIALFILVAAILGVLLSVLFTSKQDPRDASFSHMLAASDALIKSFERGQGNPQPLPVTITSDQPFTAVFYPPDLASPKCKGESCLCMYYMVNGEKKETCKTIETSDVCRPDSCGETLCPGPYSTFNFEKGDIAYLKIACTDHGSVFMLEKQDAI